MIFGSPVCGGVAEQTEGSVKPFPAARVGLVVGIGGHESDQLVQVLLCCGQDQDLLHGSRLEHHAFTVAVQQHQAPQRGGHLFGQRHGDDSAGQSGLVSSVR